MLEQGAKSENVWNCVTFATLIIQATIVMALTMLVSIKSGLDKIFYFSAPRWQCNLCPRQVTNAYHRIATYEDGVHMQRQIVIGLSSHCNT